MTDFRYWDDLGGAWCAIDLHAAGLSSRVKARLQRQAALMRMGILAGALGTAAGLALGGWTIYAGLSADAANFLVRGAAVLMLSAMLGLATAWLAAGLRDETRSLTEMLELSVWRARAFGRLTALGFAGCIVAAVLGLVGYAIRSGAGDPPELSPIEPLLLLGLFAVALLPFHLRFRDTVARLQFLRQAVTANER